MQEERRRAGARQRGGDLAADDARLAHAGDDDAARGSRGQARRPRANRSSRRSTSARIAAASVCSTLRASDRSVMRLDDPIKRDQPPQQRLEARRDRSALAASLLARAGSSCTSMNTPSTPAATPACASGSMYSARPAGDAVAGAGQLQAVRDVEDDRVAERAQHREGAHVDDQVVVAERRRRAR